MKSKYKNLLISYKSSISYAIKKLQNSSKQILFVINDRNEIVGTLTDGDLRTSFIQGVQKSDSISKYFNSNFIHANLNTSQNELIKLFKKHKVKQIPILNSKKELLDIVFIEDLIIDSKVETPVFILAGGLGSRLGNLTKTTPKPLLPIGNANLLEWHLNKLESMGFVNIFISVRYLKTEFYKYLKSSPHFKSKISIIEEDIELGTAGPIGLAKNSINDDVLILNADVLNNLNYIDLLTYHKKNNSEFTIVSKYIETDIPFGVLDLKGNLVKNIVEKPKIKNVINTGIYVINPSVFKYLKFNSKMQMDELIRKVINNKHRIMAFQFKGNWIDIGTPTEYSRAKTLIEHFF